MTLPEALPLLYKTQYDPRGLLYPTLDAIPGAMSGRHSSNRRYGARNRERFVSFFYTLRRPTRRQFSILLEIRASFLSDPIQPNSMTRSSAA